MYLVIKLFNPQVDNLLTQIKIPEQMEFKKPALIESDRRFSQKAQTLQSKLQNLSLLLQNQKTKHKTSTSLQADKVNRINTNRTQLYRAEQKQTQPFKIPPTNAKFANQPVCEEASNEIAKIREALDVVNSQKQQRYETIKDKTNQNMDMLRSTVSRWRQERVKNKEMFLKRMGEIKVDSTEGLKQERRKARLQESKFAQVLEDACDHLEAHMVDSMSSSFY